MIKCDVLVSPNASIKFLISGLSFTKFIPVALRMTYKLKIVIMKKI